MRILGVFLLTLAALSGGLLAGHQLVLRSLHNGIHLQGSEAIVGDVLEQIASDYVEELDLQAISYAAIEGALEELDRHSVFFDPERYAELKADTAGHYFGVGIEVRPAPGFGILVVGIIEGGPAESSELEEGDIITAVNGGSIAETPFNDAVDLIRGPAGEPVTLTVAKGHGDEEGEEPPAELLELTLVRAEVHTPSVSHERLELTGYIHFKQFRRGAAHELKVAVEALDEGGAQGLVIDLRGNPGGLLGEAAEAVDLFLQHGTIVTTLGRDGEVKESFEGERGAVTALPIVLLIDGDSASAAEIFAGALQIAGRVEVVGTQSYGKGSVQAIYELSDESALKLTIARYYLSNGLSIEEEGGVTPDHIVERGQAQNRLFRIREGLAESALDEDDRSYLMALMEDAGHHDREVGIRFRAPMDERIEEDPQLRRALELIGEPVE